MGTCKENLSKIGRFLQHCISPNRCACCSDVIYADQHVCPSCEEKLCEMQVNRCPVCGRRAEYCYCHRERIHMDCVAPYFYEGIIRQGLLTLKSGTTAHGTEFFAHQMARVIVERWGVGFDGIVYVPMTKAKENRRGYNQSRLLAVALGRILDLPVLHGGLTRLFDAEDQHKSNLQQRKGNVLGVFEADSALVTGKHLLLVDDIVTTGATIAECAKMLFLADCEEVCCVTVASTVLHSQKE